MTLALAALLMTSATAFAQTTVSAADIQRLQDDVYQAGSDLSRLRSNNSDQAARLQTELDELREEVIYLKVKLRKEGSVARRDYTDVRDRLQDLRSRARGESSSGWSSSAPRPGTSTTSGTGTGVSGGVSGGTSGGTVGGVAGGVMSDDRRTQGTSAIPVDYEIDVRLQTELSSATAVAEQRFEATTVADVYRGSEVLIPAGSIMRGVVSSVEKATRTDRSGRLTLAFDQVTIRGREYPMRGTVTQALESEGVRGEVGRIGAGGAIGGIIGGIMGGVKGALLGVLIGGGGTMAATPGKDVTVPAGTLLRVRFDQPPGIR
jgi:hypothetical protein